MSKAIIPAGRECRRKGFVNRLRRGVFGLLLACGATHAQAFEWTAPFDPDRDSSDSEAIIDLTDVFKPKLHLRVQLRNLSDSLGRDLSFSQAYRLPISDAEHSLARVAASGSWGLLLSADDLSRLREGSGMDLQVPALGALRLNLRMNDEAEAPWLIARGWSLGGSFEQTQVLNGASTRSGIAFVPQLVLDLAELTPVKDRLNLSFQYAHWHNRAGLATDDVQPQLLLKWSF